MTPKSFLTLAKQLVAARVDAGEFTGYTDRELDAKTDDLAADLEQTWRDQYEQIRHDEPTDEDRQIWAAEARRDAEREAA